MNLTTFGVIILSTKKYGPYENQQYFTISKRPLFPEAGSEDANLAKIEADAYGELRDSGRRGRQAFTGCKLLNKVTSVSVKYDHQGARQCMECSAEEGRTLCFLFISSSHYIQV